MSESDAVVFTQEIERMGVKLTAIRLADGQYCINRWPMINAISPQHVDGIWAANIGDDQGLIDLSAASPIRPPSANACTRQRPHESARFDGEEISSIQWERSMRRPYTLRFAKRTQRV